MKIKVMAKVLKTNEQIASGNRTLFDQYGTLAINLLGSPGAGKTTLLERTFEKLADKINVAVIEGDLYTSKDADRIERHGIKVRQINTTGGCHLDSKMIAQVLPDFNLADTDLMVIENVGNLVCPAAYDLGEHEKIVVLSIAEGGDKPLKYPRIFMESTVVIINKIDLWPFSDVDLDLLRQDIISLNPHIKIFAVSCRDGQGLDEWVNWLLERVATRGENRTVTG